MQRIPLNRGMFALVDDEVYTLVAHRKWHAVRGRQSHTWYARTNVRLPSGRKSLIDMHRFIAVGFLRDKSVRVDHRDGNGLNNTGANLRICSHAENMRNRRPRDPRKTSEFLGVSLNAKNGQWIAQIAAPKGALSKRGKQLRWLGNFASETAAAETYDRAAIQHFGDFAATNFPRSNYNERAA